MSNQIDDFRNRQDERLKWGLNILMAGGFLILIAPIALTQLPSCISFNDTGEIGDTIGGITAPIVSFVGAILVYFAFLFQIDANTLIFQQITDDKEEQKLKQNRDYVFELYKNLKEEFSTFTYIHQQKISDPPPKFSIVEYKGFDAINFVIIKHSFTKAIFINEKDKIIELGYIIELLKNFLTTVKATTLNPIDTQFFIESMEYLYFGKLQNIFNKLNNLFQMLIILKAIEPAKFINLNSEIEALITEIKQTYTEPTE